MIAVTKVKTAATSPLCHLNFGPQLSSVREAPPCPLRDRRTTGKESGLIHNRSISHNGNNMTGHFGTLELGINTL